MTKTFTVTKEDANVQITIPEHSDWNLYMFADGTVKLGTDAEFDLDEKSSGQKIVIRQGEVSLNYPEPGEYKVYIIGGWRFQLEKID